MNILMKRNNTYDTPNIIAEIGCNHKGDFNIAKRLIEEALRSGVTIVKFQKRNNKELLTESQYNAIHPNPMHSYGATYGDHREYLEFSIDQHYELKEYAEGLGLTYSSSVWDLISAKEISKLGTTMIKIPSACNNHIQMLEFLRDEYKGQVHVSFGMTNYEEEERLVDLFEEKNQSHRLVIYACTSGYPVSFNDVCLLEILRLKDKFINRVKDIGFSGHHLGISIDIAAYTLGAKWIERHFTLDRTWKGTDHAASLEPGGMSKLVRNLNATFTSLSYKRKQILDIEKEQRDKLKYRKR